VEDAGGGVEGEVLVGGYAGRVPAGLGGPFDGEHVVGEGAAEDEFLVGGEGFGCGCGGYREGGEVEGGEFGVEGVGGGEGGC